MRSNTRSNLSIKKTAVNFNQAIIKTFGYLTLGLELKQWTAMWLICLLLSPILTAPVSAAAWNQPRRNEYPQFEPVNPPQPFWKEAALELNLAMERWSYANNEAKVTNPKSESEPEDKKKESGKSAEETKTTDTKISGSPGEDSDAKSIEAGEKPTAPETGVSSEHAAAAGAGSKKASVKKALPVTSPTPPAKLMPGIIISNKSENLIPIEPPTEPPGGPGNNPPSIWNDNLWNSLFTKDNNLGSPAGQSAEGFVAGGIAGRSRERTGTSNFSFDVPVTSLPGRGLNASLGITYNSQVWNKSGTDSSPGFTYNIDRNWLAPGFNLSFGYLDGYGYGVAGSYSLISPNGTRHELFYKRTDEDNGYFIHESADGEFIQTISPYGAVWGGEREVWVKFSDGTAVGYGAQDGMGRFYATSIIDRNGNKMTIKYLAGDHRGRIDKVTDTLEREIIFHYDNNSDVKQKKLLSISVPGYGTEPRRQVIRFYYDNIAFQPRFSGAANVFGESTLPTTMNVLRYIYFPGTKSGYKYDYSPIFGIIYKITELAGIEATEAAVSNAGQEVSWTQYNYPVNNNDIPTGVLTDVPKFNERTEDWQGRNSSVVYKHTYQVTDDDTNKERTVRVTLPDGNISVTKSHRKPSAMINNVWTEYWDDGLTKEISLLAANLTVLRKQIFKWEDQAPSVGRSNPRIEKIESINEANQSTQVTYTSYDAFNNPQVITEYGFPDGNGVRPELRKTETTYATDGWSAVRLLRLPQEVKVTVGGVVVSKTKYEYDDSPNLPSNNTAPLNVVNRSDVKQHQLEYNPFANHNFQVCFNSNCVWVIVFYPEKYFKGNVTKVTSYADPTSASDPKAIETGYKYDLTGNVVEAGRLGCCQEKTWEYVKANEYAYPVSTTKGTDVQLTNKAVYDFNTGLVTQTEDENDQPTDYLYEIDTLRLKKVTYPNGGYTLTEYSDTLATSSAEAVPAFVRSTTLLETGKTVQSYSYFDGRGAVTRTAGEVPTGWNISVTEYDGIGRANKTYNPFEAATRTAAVPANVKFTQVNARDALGRTTEVKLQDDTLVKSAINGTVATVEDQAGKKRRQISDALGRIVRVDEPDASGDLGLPASPKQPTLYEYDGNDNLTKVTQTVTDVQGKTVQERVFKYDGLSRLTHERQPEADATLNDSGVPGTVGAAKWTKYLEYDNLGLLIKAVDARGVITNFADYDGLNRLKQITYSDGTPNVTYTYDQNDGTRANFFNKGKLTRVETAAGSTTLRPDAPTPATATEFDYDKMGRVKLHRQSIGAQTYNLEYEYNLAGQLTKEIYPSGRAVSVGYDAKGRMANVADASRTYLSNLQYQGKAGSLSSMALGNGTVQSFELNDRLQLTQQQLTKGSDVIQKYVYNYGELNASSVLKNTGKLEQVESYIGSAKQWTQKFAYDSIGRLAEAKEYRGDSPTTLSYRQQFDYDEVGNLYRKAAANSTAGQQTPLGYTAIENGDISKSRNRLTTNTQYDAAGNVIQDTKFRNQNFWYDASGRMYQTSSTNSPNQSNAVYDAAGNRVAQQIDNVWTFFIYDASGKMVAEYGGLQGTDEGGVKYLIADWQGSTRAITNNTGVVQARMDYTAFGEEINANIGQRTTAQGFEANNNLRNKYALTERDGATGLDHTWFRKNENKAGRWTSPDPYNGSMSLGNPQSFNRYSYVENQPTNFVDPNGLFPIGPGNRQRSWLEICWLLGVCGNPTPGSNREEEPSGGGGGGGVNHCETLAANAQNIANFINEKLGSLNPMEKLVEFSRELDYWYNGGWSGQNSLTAADYKYDHGGFSGSQGETFRSSGPKKIGNVTVGSLSRLGDGYFGPNGFNRSFIDSQDPKQDIAHHVVAYLSTGINNLEAGIAGIVLEGLAGNGGDETSARAAYALGQKLSNDPTKLNNIGSIIKEAFCGN